MTKASSSALALLGTKKLKKLASDVLPDASTANGAPAFSSTGSARLDLFFSGMVRGADEAKICRLLTTSFLEGSADTVRILLHARDIRGDGKGERLVVTHALMWLRQNKPATYLLNVDTFVSLGYFKDLLVIALQVHERKLPKLGTRELVELEILAGHLRLDAKRLDDGAEAVSLAGKWAPTLGGAADRKACLAKRLARLLFPGEPKAFQLYRCLLSKLRAHLRVTERLICQGKWDKVQFSQVPSKAHQLLKQAFSRHESERYQQYLERLAEGKEKICAGAIHPHEVAGQYINRTLRREDATVEGQWRAILDKTRKAVGNGLGSALSVVDVSGSMSGLPMTVAVTLGLIVADMAGGPFKNRMITFHRDPKWHCVRSNTSLFEKVESALRMPWGMNTDFFKVFQMILSTALEHNTKPEDMPQTLFVFSDMEFDRATTDPYESTHKSVIQLYERHGYTPPAIVYWNLNGRSNTVPVRQGEAGVSLISGFSIDLLKLFLGGEELSPLAVMMRAIADYPAVVHPDEEGRVASEGGGRAAVAQAMLDVE